MASSSAHPASGSSRGTRFFNRLELVLLAVLLVLLTSCAVYLWITRDAVSSHPRSGRTSRHRAAQTIVDLQPWQTAQTLAALATSTQEIEFAREAKHLADHEVDQAFAAALRKAHLEASRHQLTSEALAISQKVTQLEQLKRQDQTIVDNLKAKSGTQDGTGDDELEEAKAQLDLDSDELADAQLDLQRATGDNSAQIQDELTAHEASMRKSENDASTDGQGAPIHSHTLSGRIASWFDQSSRMALLEQAQQDALNDAKNIAAEHNEIENRTKAAADPGTAPDHAAKLTRLKNLSNENQILSIDDDRVQTEQQLASVYDKWYAQVERQHRRVMHQIVQALTFILAILTAMLLLGTLVRRFMARPAIDRRKIHTLRSILELGIQALGIVLILLVIFGAPKETPTILGLATAALTIALQDYILAFLGWFALMGKNGIHVGDWVEINGVGGEVTSIRLMTTTLLETGGLADQGQPTGRRITFMNSFAIRGQFFNFSTAGQWMWDEISVGVPADADVHSVMETIQRVVLDETQENSHRAENEWKKALRDEGLHSINTAPVVSLRPSGTGINLQIRYVTSATSRFEQRNRLYERVVELLRAPSAKK